jgi:hypothetical protein
LLLRITGRVVFGTLEIKERRPSTMEAEPSRWMKMLGMGD